jgi:leader peptidase (prepilin peptidase) / N-methyltransferase
MKTIEILLVLLYSALFGGLLTVLSYRLPLMLTGTQPQLNLFFPSSHCPQCKAKIHWLYKLPIIGYFISAGHCQSCKEKINLQYVLTEITFTLIAVTLFISYGFTLKFMFLLIFAFLGMALFLIDMRYALLPDVLVFSLTACGLIASTLNVFVGSTDAIVGCVTGFIVAASIGWIYQCVRKREGLGFGDVKLLSALGAWLGPFVLPFVLLQASILLIAYATFFMALSTRKKSFLRLKVAFGPFLILAGGFLLIVHPNWAQAKAQPVYDSSSFVNNKTHDANPICYLDGDPKPVTFDASQTTKKCSDAFKDGNYVVVGISSDSGKTKTMYCQKLVCSYKANKEVNFYNLPSS